LPLLLLTEIVYLIELNCTTTHLALAWVAKNPNTSTVILGATSPAQVLDNLKAIEVLNKLTPELMEKIDEIMKNKPNKDVRACFIELEIGARC